MTTNQIISISFAGLGIMSLITGSKIDESLYENPQQPYKKIKSNIANILITSSLVCFITAIAFKEIN